MRFSGVPGCGAPISPSVAPTHIEEDCREAVHEHDQKSCKCLICHSVVRCGCAASDSDSTCAWLREVSTLPQLASALSRLMDSEHMTAYGLVNFHDALWPQGSTVLIKSEWMEMFHLVLPVQSPHSIQLAGQSVFKFILYTSKSQRHAFYYTSSFYAPSKFHNCCAPYASARGKMFILVVPNG
jgi:hypothetical protein